MVTSTEYPKFITDPRIKYGAVVAGLSSTSTLEEVLAAAAQMLPKGKRNPQIKVFREMFKEYDYPIDDIPVVLPTATFASFEGCPPHEEILDMWRPTDNYPATIEAANMVFVAWHGLQHLKRTMQNHAEFSCVVVSPVSGTPNRTPDETYFDYVTMLHLGYTSAGVQHRMSIPEGEGG